VTGDFAPIEAVARVMSGFPHPWFVSGGWAIDLFRGQVTRGHEDLEVGILRADQGALYRHLADWQVFKALDGAWVPLEAGESVELPLHQVLARPPTVEPGDPAESSSS
jgi:hypothetical protein